jgi:hypothetical protein
LPRTWVRTLESSESAGPPDRCTPRAGAQREPLRRSRFGGIEAGQIAGAMGDREDAPQNLQEALAVIDRLQYVSCCPCTLPAYMRSMHYPFQVHRAYGARGAAGHIASTALPSKHRAAKPAPHCLVMDPGTPSAVMAPGTCRKKNASLSSLAGSLQWKLAVAQAKKGAADQLGFRSVERGRSKNLPKLSG